MINYFSSKPLSILVLGTAALLFAGCHSNQQTSTTDNGTSTATPADQSQQASQDEASGNLVPVANTSGATDTSNASTSSSATTNSGSAATATADGGGDDTADETAYGVQPAATAAQPPPELPQYDQPPCPEDGDLWTPGYWGWASTGYYWVPGAWVQAPYQGALWTPGYWGYSHNRYAYFAGYWGPHIGFYGGINYGFGYVGLGYQGGYWNAGHFLYNRAVNNVNVAVIHNVYNRTVINNTVVNRVSFNGGSGGIQVRPRLAELAALREPHAPPMRAQIEVQHTASQNRAQFATVNHGRPATFVETHAVVADHDVHPVAIRNLHNLPAAARPVTEANRVPEPANRAEPNSAPGRPEAARPAEGNHPAPNRPEVKPGQNRPEPNRAEPQRRPEETHEAPQHKPAPAEHKPAPERKPAPKKPSPDHKAPDPEV
jgi:WXXGXW repeat (2 copies)